MSDTAKHTPGPWTLNKGFRKPVVGIDVNDGGDLLPICPTVEGYSIAQANANARLIAAAPDLLAALLAAETLFACLCRDSTALAWLDKARSTLAAATGGQQS